METLRNYNLISINTSTLRVKYLIKKHFGLEASTEDIYKVKMSEYEEYMIEEAKWREYERRDAECCGFID
jgi:hypothetical protein